MWTTCTAGSIIQELSWDNWNDWQWTLCDKWWDCYPRWSDNWDHWVTDQNVDTDVQRVCAGAHASRHWQDTGLHHVSIFENNYKFVVVWVFWVWKFPPEANIWSVLLWKNTEWNFRCYNYCTMLCSARSQLSQVCLSVCLSICHTRGLCSHGLTYDHMVAPWFYSFCWYQIHPEIRRSSP